MPPLGWQKFNPTKPNIGKDVVLGFWQAVVVREGGPSKGWTRAGRVPSIARCAHGGAQDLEAGSPGAKGVTG